MYIWIILLFFIVGGIIIYTFLITKNKIEESSRPSLTTIPIVYIPTKTPKSSKINTIYEYELDEMEKPYIPTGTSSPISTYKPSTSYCNTLVKLNAMNYLQNNIQWTPRQRTDVLSLINTALQLSLEQRQLLVLLSNIQLRSLIDINCLLLKNDPNYINITNYTQWDTSYRNAVISNIYTLIEGPKTDYIYSSYSILPFIQSLTNEQLHSIII